MNFISILRQGLLLGATLTLSTFALINCGGSSTSSSTPSFSTADSLPESTGVVIDGGSSSSSISSNMKSLGTSSTGMLLGTVTSSDWTTGKSHGACQMFNQVKTAIGGATQGELIQCYVTSTFETFATAAGVDLYDGAEHVFALDFTGSSFDEGDEEHGGGPSKIKVKFEKNSAGNITLFEMFSCGDGGSGDVQSEYIKKLINDTAFSMDMKSIGSRGTQSYADHSTVTGTLGSDGNFIDEVDGVATPKVITQKHTFQEGDDNDFWMNMTFTWSADAAQVAGSMNGSFGECSFSDTIFSSLDLADTNAVGADPWQVGLLELRDGAVKGSSSGSCTGDHAGTWEGTYLDAWDAASAESLSDASTSSHFETVNTTTLTAATEPSITFETGETWDCSDTAEATIVFADLGVDIEASCSHLEVNHSHIECHNLFEE